MITFERCKEIFSDREKFEVTDKGGGTKYTRVTMHLFSKDGEVYEFGYRRMPNGYNDAAEVFMGKWTPMRSYIVAHQICDERFLLALIKQCHEVGNL